MATIAEDLRFPTIAYCWTLALMLATGGFLAIGEPLAAQERPQPDRQVMYRQLPNDVELRLHIFEPPEKAEEPRAAIVFFFGGGWQTGTPAQFYPQCRHLADRGMVAISAEYRVKSRHGTSPQECVADGKAAIRYVRQHAKELGVDPQRVVAAGGSAGGHVAACTGVVPGFEGDGYSTAAEDAKVSSRPNAMILFNPALDLLALSDRLQALRAEELKAISPAEHVDAAAPPTLIFHGTADDVVPIETARTFAQKMKAADRVCTLAEFPEAKHGFFNRSPAYEATLQQADAFLAKLGYLPKQAN